MKRLYKILKQLAPEKLFLTIAIPFGLLFLITIPALQGWDEATHFLRTYQISEGHMTASEVGPSDWGGQLPITVLQMNDAFVSDLVQSAQSNLERSVHTRAYLTYLTEFTPSPETAARGFSSSAVYSPVAYAPQAFAIAIAKLVHLPLISYIYIGRLAVFALWLFLTFQAIKRIPFGKWLIVAVGLLPTTMTVAVSLAPDALVVGCSALLVALFADYLVKPRRISQRDLLLIVALSITLAVTKQTYILLAGMFLFLPFQVYRTKKRYFATNGLIIGLALLTAIAWFAVVANISQDIHITQRPGIAVSPAEQTTYVASNPHEYGAILTNNIVNNNSNPQLLQATGTLTWKGIRLPLWTILLSYLVLLVTLVSIRQEAFAKKITINRITRYGVALIILGVSVLIYTSLYVAFSILESTNIEGVQGRYFIPLIPLLGICILPLRHIKPSVNFSQGFVGRFVGVISAFVLLISAVLMIAANFIPDMF